MHQVYVDILISAIVEQYYSEENFFETQLGISAHTWNEWKRGSGNLPSESMQKIKGLFSDYEWMLVQKILRQTILFPEQRNNAVLEYKRLKTAIAQTWLKGAAAEVEMVPFTIEHDGQKSAYIDLRVSLQYGTWGYDDILSFRMPSIIQQQIEGAKIPLLDWVSENLADTYH